MGERSDEDLLRLPLAARARAERFSQLLSTREIRRVTFSPLILKQPVSDLLRRRRLLFSHLDVSPKDFGCTVAFQCQKRPSRRFPRGEVISGEFDLMEITDRVWLLASTLFSDAEVMGPGNLARRAYPLAVRPFIRSKELLDYVVRLARDREWMPVCTDAMAYDRDTRDFRRDMKRQPVGEAFREMVEQGRQMHQMRVSFKGSSKQEQFLASFNRYGRAVVDRGSAVLALLEFVLPAAIRSMRRSEDLSVAREGKAGEQKLVRLVFPSNALATREDLRSLCEAVRLGDGLNVTTVHLNPYLNAQVLDFLTGGAVQLLVMDIASVSLIPRSGTSQATLERIITTVSRYFGEPDRISVEPVVKV